MAEVSNELIYEILRTLQERLADVSRRIDGVDRKVDHLAAEVRILHGHMAAFMGAETLKNVRFAEVEARLDRIERRLEIVD